MAYKNNDLTSHIRSVAAQNANAIRSSETEDELNSIVDGIIADGQRGYVDRFVSNFKGGAAGVGSGLAQFVGANDTAESLNKVVENNTNRRQYNSIFDEGYLTDPQGLVSTIGNQLGSMAALLPFGIAAEAVLPTAAIGAGAAGLLTGSLARLGAKNISTKLAEKLAGEGVEAFAKRATQGALSGVAESASEGGNVEKELLDDGKNPGYAAEKGREVFAKNLPFLMASNAIEYLALSGKLSNPGAKATEGMGTRALKAPMRMAPDTLANAIQNGYEEVFQQTFSDEALGHPTGTPWDHTSWTPGQRQAFEMGFAGSGAIGAGTGMYHGMRVQKKDQKKNDNPPKNNQQATAKQMSEAAGQAAVQQVAQEVVANNTPQQQSQGTDAGFESFFNSIAQQESDGDYNAVGKPVDESGDYAIGKYQIMKSNWASWAQEAGLPPDAEPTPENQDIVARNKMKQYYDKYGARGAALAWYGGEGALNYSEEALNKRQTSADGTVFPSLNDYADQVTGRAGGEGIDMGSATSSTAQATAPKAQEAEQTYEDIYNEVLSYADTLPVSTEAELAVANPIYETLDSGDKNAVIALAEKLGLRRGNKQAGENLQAEEQTQPQASLEDISPMHNEEDDGEAVPGREIVKPAPTVQPQAKAIVTDKRVAHLENQQAAITQRPAGKTVTSTTDANNMAKFPTQYRLVEASDLTTSNNPDDFSTNELYPAELQPKSRDTAPLAGQVMNIAGKGTMEPMLLINRDININSGAPLINEFGIVENGNGRSMGVTRAYKAGEAGRKYKAYLAENAEDFGFTREQVDGMQQPVLVRQRMSDDVDLQKIISANAGGASMSSSDQARIDAKAISSKTLSLYQPDLKDGLYADTNNDFVSAAIAEIAHGNAGELNQLVTGDNMRPSTAGYKRVKDAVFALAYQDDTLLSKMSEDRNGSNILSVLDAMEKVAPAFARVQALMDKGILHKFDVAKAVADAAKKLIDLRFEKKPVATFLVEQQLDGIGNVLSEESRNLLRGFDKYKYAKGNIYEMLKDIPAGIEAVGPANQESMFGVLPTLNEIIANALKIPLKEMKGDEKGLFKEKPASKLEGLDKQNAQLGQAEKPAEQQAERMGGDGQNATVGSSEAPQSDGKNQGIKERQYTAEETEKIFADKGFKVGDEFAISDAMHPTVNIFYGKIVRFEKNRAVTKEYYGSKYDGSNPYRISNSGDFYIYTDGVGGEDAHVVLEHTDISKIAAAVKERESNPSQVKSGKEEWLNEKAETGRGLANRNFVPELLAKYGFKDGDNIKLGRQYGVVKQTMPNSWWLEFTFEEDDAGVLRKINGGSSLTIGAVRRFEHANLKDVAKRFKEQKIGAEGKATSQAEKKSSVSNALLAKIKHFASLVPTLEETNAIETFTKVAKEEGEAEANKRLDRIIASLEQQQEPAETKVVVTDKVKERIDAKIAKLASLDEDTTAEEIRREFDKTVKEDGLQVAELKLDTAIKDIEEYQAAHAKKQSKGKTVPLPNDMLENIKFMFDGRKEVFANSELILNTKDDLLYVLFDGDKDTYERRTFFPEGRIDHGIWVYKQEKGKVYDTRALLPKDKQNKELSKLKYGYVNEKDLTVIDKKALEPLISEYASDEITNTMSAAELDHYGYKINPNSANADLKATSKKQETTQAPVTQKEDKTFRSRKDNVKNLANVLGIKTSQELKAEKQAKDTVKIVNIVDDSAAHEAEILLRMKNRNKGKLNSTPMFDPENMQDALELGLMYAQRGINKFSDWSKHMIEKLGDTIKPWLGAVWKSVKSYPEGVQFEAEKVSAVMEYVGDRYDAGNHDIDSIVKDWQEDFGDEATKQFKPLLKVAFAGIHEFYNPTIEGGENDVHNGRTEDTERNRAGNNQDAVGQADGGTITDGSGTDSNGQAESGRSADDGEGGLHSRSAATGGEIGDSGVQSETSGSIEDSAGSSDLPADSRANLEGLSAIDDGRSEADVKTAQDGRNHGAASNEKINKEILKELSRYDANFIESIQKDLPFLTTGQTLDVAFAEKRLFDNHGQGVMFTNGTGTGKTFSGLGIAKRLVDAGKKNILIVTPSQDINTQWQSAAEKFFGMNISVLKDTQDAGEGMVITTYANFQANNQLSHREWDMVIADEAHNLMSSENGDMTSNLLNLRALTYHKAGFRERALRLLETPEMREIDKEMKRIEADIDELEQLGDIKEMTPKVRNKELPKISTTEALQRIEAKEAQKERLKKKLEKMWEALEPEIQRLTEEWGKILPADKPKVVFLSATPFNYVFNIDYAEGYLFDFAEPKRQGGYNQPNARDKFYMDNFAYRMRTGKLTKPEGNVQNRILEVQFHEKLKKEGILSDHVLDVDVDYDRGFIVVEDPDAQDGKGIGEKIDEGFEWLRETQKGRYRELYDALSEQYTSKQRNYLLESIKARGSISLIQKYLESGKKVVVYHQRKKEQELRHPFILDIEKVPRDEHYDNVLRLYRQFKENRPDLLALNFRDLKTPIETYQEAFGEDVMIYNGDTRPKKKAEYIKAFNTDHNNRNLLVVQVDAGNAGISLHDTTGEHQRVLINISIPPRPSYAMQIEGRIFRFGSVSNAIFRYLSTGTTLEKTLFANTLAGKVSTAENLGMGVQARNLRDSFVNLYSETLDGSWRNKLPGAEGEGTGGKAADNALDVALSEFERAKTFYYANQKKTARTKSAEGVDYYATPEPLGYKMVEWLNAKLNDNLLEPSAGHGAISRFFSEDTFNTIVEPSAELLPVAQLHTVNAKVVAERFEDFNIINKFDGIAMNPPYGVGGKTAMEHIEKAFKQLRNGGRLIAIVPNGPSMDKRLDNFAESKEAKHIYKVAEVILPSSTFGRAGTNVNTKLLVFDKYEDEKIAEKFQTSMYIDLSNAKSNEELFNRIENLSMPDRIKISTDAESNPEGRQTKQGSKHGIIGVSADMFIHTKTRAEIPSAKLVTDSFDPEGFAMLKEIAKKYDGYWDHRFANAFLFKSLEGRNQFVAEGDKAVSDRYRQSMKNGDDTQYSVQDNLANAVLSEAQWEKAIKDAFKGLPVDRIDGTHFAVQLPSGNQVYVETGAKISFTSVDKERAEQALGRKLLPNERPVGFTKTVDGARVIGLADGATAQTVDHEAFHVAMAMALNKQEYLAMLKRYRNTDGSFNEEQAADDYAAFASKKRQITGLFAKLFEKIKYFIAKAKMKLGFGGASDVFRAVKNGDVWQKATNGKASTAYKVEKTVTANNETAVALGENAQEAATDNAIKSMIFTYAEGDRPADLTPVKKEINGKQEFTVAFYGDKPKNYVPKMVGKAYKLMELWPNGTLHPLFAGYKNEYKLGEWHWAAGFADKADRGAGTGKGIAARYGWHMGTGLPSTHHLMGIGDATNPIMQYPSGNKEGHPKGSKRVWVEVLYDASNDYTDVAERNPDSKEKDIRGLIPFGGFYMFTESNLSNWILASGIKFNRVLSETERQGILEKSGWNEEEMWRSKVLEPKMRGQIKSVLNRIEKGLSAKDEKIAFAKLEKMFSNYEGNAKVLGMELGTDTNTSDFPDVRNMNVAEIENYVNTKRKDNARKNGPAKQLRAKELEAERERIRKEAFLNPEVTDLKFSIQQATETLAENVGAQEKGTIEVMEKAKAPDVDLTDAIVTSPWRIAQRVPGFRMIHKWAISAINLQEKLRSNYGRKLSAALKIVNSKKLKEDLYSLLWRGDLEAKEWTREELVAEGFDENVIESYMQVRRLIKTAYTKMNEARKHVKTYSKNMSASQLETLKANKFVEILGEPQETGNDNYLVTWKEPQNWLKHYSGIDAATYARFLNSPDIQILTATDYADLDGNTVYDLDVRERIGDINERIGYIPHFFHDFFIMEKKTDEEGNDTYKVLGPVGSAKTLKQAYKIAQEYQKKNPAMNIVIKPKEFHLDKEAEQAIVIGDMDYEKVTQRLAKDNEMAITEVKEMLDGNIRLKGRHRFFGNLLERKGVDGYEKDMEWVLRHYFNGVSRYVALESEFKPKAISMFERVYGAFDKEYTGTAKYVKDFINDVNGNPSALEQLINNKLNNNELWRKHVASHFGDRAALQLAGSITNNVSVLKLGLFNVSSALLNLTQLINAAGILGSVPAVFDGIQRLTHLTMRDRGVLVATGVVNDIGMDSGSGYTKLTVGKLKNSTMFLFKKSEQLCRYGTVLAAYHKAVAEGKTHKQAIDYAKLVNRRANFDYSVADAPNVFRRGSIISQIVLQFKKYPIKQFELMKDMLSDRTDYKQKAIFWGGYFLLSGLLQVPVIDWFDDLVKGFTGDSKKLSAKKALMEFAGDNPQLKFLAEWAMYGAGSTVGVDFSNRTGMANVIPQKLDKYTLGGPAFSTIYGFLVNMYQNEPLAAAKAFSPGVANIMQVAVGHSEGKRGRVDTVYDTAHEKIAKLLGFNTIDSSVGSDFKKIVNQAENQKTKARQKAMDAYIANPTQENWKEMKALGVTPKQVRAERKKKNTPTIEMAKKDIDKKDRKDYRDLMKYINS